MLMRRCSSDRPRDCASFAINLGRSLRAVKLLPMNRTLSDVGREAGMSVRLKLPRNLPRPKTKFQRVKFPPLAIDLHSATPGARGYTPFWKVHPRETNPIEATVLSSKTAFSDPERGFGCIRAMGGDMK